MLPESCISSSITLLTPVTLLEVCVAGLYLSILNHILLFTVRSEQHIHMVTVFTLLYLPFSCNSNVSDAASTFNVIPSKSLSDPLNCSGQFPQG